MPKCYRCGKEFTSNQSLHYHLVKKKTKCNELKCKNCGKIFNNITDLEIHENNCKNENNYLKCKETNKEFGLMSLQVVFSFVVGDLKTLMWKYISPSFETQFDSVKLNDLYNHNATTFINNPEEKLRIFDEIINKHTVHNQIVHFKFPNNDHIYKTEYSSLFIDDDVILVFKKVIKT